MVSAVARYCLYILLYIPLELVYIILFVNMFIYHLIVYIIDIYYYVSQREARLQGLPYSKVVNYQEKLFYWLESENNHSYNTLISKLGKKIKFEDWKNTFNERILNGIDKNGEALFPKFRQVIQSGLVFDTWGYEGEINIENHSREIELNLSRDGAIEEYLGQLESVPLPTKRPEWHLYFVSDPNIEDYCYIIWRLNHSLADGISTWKVFLKTCDVSHKDELEPNRLAALQVPYWRRTLAKIQTFFALPVLAIDIRLFIAESDRKYTNSTTGVKKIAWTNKLDFEKIRLVKKKTKTTVNDVLMSLVTESLRRYFTIHPHGDIIKSKIIFGSGMAIEGTMDNDVLTNNVLGICIRFPAHIEGVFEQLKVIHRNMNIMKFGLWPWFFSMTLNSMLALPIPSSVKMNQIKILTVLGVYSNVPGPTSILQHNGVSYEELYGVVMTSWDQSMSLVFSSYRGSMHLAVKIDTILMEDPNEFVNMIPQVLEDMYKELC
ncbi:diacylglycerol O-acyltransferase [Oopsacas minuta]|uniref:Diacylglycerol O-acyltransferase n=1 Tax=Oopsacas minuta TaxID=111878 RepID=A0AAV7JIZ3_9METZ|nr:diacylglycerol O-acyltransferase [Oopsacas minuta]